MKRYALYYAPEPSPLADFGAEWLGWDAERGVAVAHPDLGLPIADLTIAPRKYGLHATLKAPFRLQGSFEDLDVAAAKLAAGLDPVMLEGLEITRLASFLALRPTGDLTALNQLAAAVTSGLDAHRAPLTEAEISRRNPDRLTPYQRDMLDKWGYPHVMEDFRFHITLTSSLPDETLAEVEQVLYTHLDPILPRPFVIRQICLFGETQDGSFRLMKRYPLGHAAS